MNRVKQEKTRAVIEGIMAAARDEFARKGFAGARVDEIARRAGVNKATLYYHIGDKKALYTAVIHDVIGTAAMMLADGVRGRGTPEEKIRTYIKILAKTLDENPQMPRIMMREIASGGQTLPDVFFVDLLSIIETLGSVIEEGRTRGVFTDAMPLIVHFMAVGATVIYKSIAPIMQSKREIPAEMKGATENVSGAIADEIERLILKALSVKRD